MLPQKVMTHRVSGLREWIIFVNNWIEMGSRMSLLTPTDRRTPSRDLVTMKCLVLSKAPKIL